MDFLRTPDQAFLPQRRSADDEESIPLHEYNRPRLPEPYHPRSRDLVWIARLLSRLIPEIPGLPLDSAQHSQGSRPARNIEPTNPAPTRQNRPFIPQFQATSSTSERSDSVGNQSTEDMLDIIDSRQVSHEARTNELREVLKPILRTDDSDNPFVLLCWGESSCCHILPVKVTNSANEVAIWQEIRGAWYASKGSWKKYLPFFNAREVDIVEVSIAGQELIRNQQSTYKDGFIGTYTTDDLLSKKKRLEQIIADYQPQQFPCPYDSSTGCVNCFEGCISSILDDEECPEKRLYEAERELSSLSRGPFLKLAFLDPNVAAFNSFFSREGAIVSHLDILRKLDAWHCPDLRELRFRGVLIRESWSYSQHIVWPLASTVLFLMVVVSRLVYGDWGTAWNVGCFLVSLITLAAGDKLFKRGNF